MVLLARFGFFSSPGSDYRFFAPDFVLFVILETVNQISHGQNRK